MTSSRLHVTRSRATAEAWFFTCFAAEASAGASAAVEGLAYAVPWQVLRFEQPDHHARPCAAQGPNLTESGDAQTVLTVVNAGSGVLLQVRVLRSCGCGLRASLPRRSLPGDQLTVKPSNCLRSACGDGRWFMRWFTQEGVELVWPFVW